ncbi:hypothetical protein RJT34_02425 [Clitoria ternatea]|uniref:Uncharacterized protein n=1 Tax=Clitoria ternatea TaxID=43366 RepID=A0AAN9Q0Y0_CLITE
MVLFKRISVPNFLITFFLLSLLSVNCQILESPSPLVPDITNFIDKRLAQVFPIIQTFKNTITSDPFGITTTWVGPNICNYTGFYCDSPPDNITATTIASIDFNGFQLAAPTLDGFIDQFPDLAIFHANTNKFSGIISPKVAGLEFLYELDLSNNLLSGVFPISVLKIPNLSLLDIRYNMFSGTVPPPIFMQKLDVLFLNNNNFMLTLPNNLGDTPVFYLTLANNKFTGPIPRSIRKASSTLVEVLLLNNLLTGCVPYEVGLLGNVTLFDAGGNLLTGPIPWSFGCLKKIEQLNLARNFLYGQVPEVVCALGNLANLSLSNNYFTRVGPLCKKLIQKGVLDVRKNCIFGLPDQRPVRECVAFFLIPRPCSHPALLNFIPCEISHWKKPHERTKRHLLSYSTLSRTRVVW